MSVTVLESIQQLTEWRAALSGTLGFVPTMGALHDGHLSLIRSARAECDHVAVSVFVNPTQFAPGEDLDTYPRDAAGDVEKSANAGADMVFLGTTADLYPEGFSTRIEVPDLSARLCGRTRPHHFGGVCVIVLKLFQLFRPNRAYFGKKDYQQLAIIRRMVRDLDVPVQIVGCPIVRESDGLAMSSRNAGLSHSQRQQALVLSAGLAAALERFSTGVRQRSALMRAALDVILSETAVELEYLDLVDAASLAPVTSVEARAVLTVAARVGAVRLIDNVEARTGSAVMTFALLPIARDGDWITIDTPAKLNLFLEVLRKREDGYHEISTLMVPVDFHDRLSVREAPSGVDVLNASGVPIPPGKPNTVTLALERVRARASVPPVEIRIDKSIPAGSGLGGGSANAAGLLAALQAHGWVDLEPSEWLETAAEVGSDVPFFLMDGACVASGRGEVLEPFVGKLFGGDQPHFLLVIPEVHSDSAEAYGGVTFPLTSPDGAISFPAKCFVESRHWLNGLFNRLKTPVLARKETLRRTTDWLEVVAPGRWGMTGSGSTLFAVCFSDDEARELEQLVLQHRVSSLPDISTRVVRSMI